jgi:CRP-like cAMP-binding protein/Ca2+-binding EF-hand superfamily protein
MLAGNASHEMSASNPTAASDSAFFGPPASVIRFLALFVPLLALTVPVFWIQAHVPEAPISAAIWALVVLSALANIIVIAYHYIIPPHPKFLMVPWRRFVLRVHILGGTVELVAGLIACFTHNPTAAIIMAVSALLLHVPSALFQTRIVFGSKAIMVPAYLLCIITHAFCAGMLLTHPESRVWAVNTFLVFNVYVWCRIYYYIFDMLKLFSSMKYSIAILAAGATMIPALFGSLGLMLLVGFIGTYILLYRLIFVRSGAEYLDFVREKARDSAARTDLIPLWGNLAAGARETDADARGCFDRLKAGREGPLTRAELREALAFWGLNASAVDAYVDQLLEKGPVDFDRFKREVWSIGAVRTHLLNALVVARAVSDRDKAELVFRHLDFNGDGYLSPADLDRLLLDWGLPQSETRRYLAQTKTEGDGRVAFSEFLRSMEPVWRYIYYEVFLAEYTRHSSEMIGRGISAVRDARRSTTLRERVKRQLLVQIPFLAGAGDELISDLASSLVEERYRAGETVFLEGSEGNKLYLVASGIVRVTKAGDTLAELGPGGSLGEGSLLTDQPRSATVTAYHDSILFFLTRASFNYLTEAYPDVRAQLRSLHMNRRVSTTTRMLERQLAAHLLFLGGSPVPSLIAELASHLTPVYCRAGETLVREGEAGDCFYIIGQGSVRVSRGGETLAVLSIGGCIGEGALLTKAARTATATAVEDTCLYALNRQPFQSIIERYPEVKAALSELHRSRTSSPYGDGAEPLAAAG